MRSKSPIFRRRKTHVYISLYFTKLISKIILVEIPGSESVSLCGGDKPLWRISPPQNHQGYSFIRHNMPCVFHILTSIKVVSAKEKNIFRGGLVLRQTCTLQWNYLRVEHGIKRQESAVTFQRHIINCPWFWNIVRKTLFFGVRCSCSNLKAKSHLSWVLPYKHQNDRPWIPFRKMGVVRLLIPTKHTQNLLIVPVATWAQINNQERKYLHF